MRPWSHLAASTFLLLPAVLQAQSVEERARTAASASRAKTGSSDVLLDTYVRPALSGEAVTTIDGSKSFTPAIACQKSAKLLEVLIQPAATGDIGLVRISRDTDMDGTFDTSSNLPVPISGICANGVLSCDPGTWANCRSFRWGVDAAKDLKLTEVQMPELAGCYCVNASCGSNLVFGNLATVLKDLGGGMVGALTTAFPAIGVAEARINGPVIDYVGALTTSCTGGDATAETAYRKNPTAIGGDAFALSSTNSVFQALQGSAAGSGKAEVTRSCTIEREITVRSWTFDDVLGVSGAVQSVTSCGTDCLRYRIGGNGNCSDVPPLFSAIIDTHAPDRIVSARVVGLGADDWVQGRVNSQIIGSAGKRPWLTDGLPTGDCRQGGSDPYVPLDIDIAPLLKAGSTTVAARVRGGGDGRQGYIDIEITAKTGCDVSERLIDLCAANAADDTCRLYNETVDGVATVVNGVGTGLRPLRQTRLFGTGACTFQFARDFFSRERKYRCIVDSAALPEPDLSRGAHIIDNSTETLLADRQTASDGTVTTSTRPFSLPDRGSVPTCEAICKTRAPRANTDAAPAGVVGAKQNDPAGYDSFYHVCDSANACPAGPGEKIVSACGCLDDFPEAVVMMQTVRLAGADMVCTSAVR